MLFRENDTLFSVSKVFTSEVKVGFTTDKVAGVLPDEIEKLFPHQGFAYLKQIHSDKVHLIDHPGMYEGDGLFTQKKDLILVVKTADCLPLVFYSRELGVAGVVHMGWRGAKAGILNNIPFSLKSFSVFAGVGMRKCCYLLDNKYFDPINFAKDMLFKKGLLINNFYDLNICSVCSKEQFFSYRRTKTNARTLTYICRTI